MTRRSFQVGILVAEPSTTSGGEARRLAAHATPQALSPCQTAGRSRRDSESPSAGCDVSRLLGIANTNDRSVVCDRSCRTTPSIRRGTGLVPRLDCGATSRRFRGSVRLLRVRFLPAGSPALAQFVQNCRRWPEMTRLGGSPRRGQRFVQSMALLVSEVITFVVRDEVDNRSLG
jgi:hypothetical protein